MVIFKFLREPCSSFVKLYSWETLLKICCNVCSFSTLLLPCVSKVHRVDGGARLPPANQILGLGSLTGVEGLWPGRD